MAILRLVTSTAGEEGFNPRLVRLETTDTYATITTAGYLTDAIQEGIYNYRASDIFFVSISSGNPDLFVPTISNNIVTLNPYTGSGVTLPVTSGDFAIFNGTYGVIKDSGYAPPAADASANSDATVSAVSLSSNTANVWSFANTLPRYSFGSLTLSQIVLLYTTPQILIPAPGAGFVNQVLQFTLEQKTGGTAVTGGGAVYLEYGATAHGENYASSTIAATFFTGASTSVPYIINVAGNINSTSGFSTSTIQNTAVSITNDTAVFANGTGTTWNWSVLYNIVPVS